MPKRENGFEPTFLDAVKEFPQLQEQHRTTNEKFFVDVREADSLRTRWRCCKNFFAASPICVFR